MVSGRDSGTRDGPNRDGGRLVAGCPARLSADLCRYWADDYDWSVAEARLNGVPQFRTVVEGLRIHFLHARSRHVDALPLVLTHGWPGSVVEFLKVIDPLTDPTAHGGDPSDAFHVVCPSLPGFAFSDKPTRTGWGLERIAAAWAALMARLGYERYGAQGSDWGTSVSALIGERNRNHVAGVHLMPPLAPPDPATLDDLTDARKGGACFAGARRQVGVRLLNRAGDPTAEIGYALAASPAALAGWIIEKFWAWTDHDGSVEGVLSRDELIETR